MKTRNIYQIPEIEVINLECEDTIMAASITYNEVQTTNGVARGHERSFWDE